MKQTVLVTGASRGIGEAIATRFAREGYPVAVNFFRNRARAEALCQRLSREGCFVLPVGADVSDQEQVEKMFAETERALGPVGILVNNAGVDAQGLLTDLPIEDWDRLFAVDVRSVFLCSRRALPDMIRQHNGVIINVSSVWGIAGASCEVAYSAAKAAVIGFTKALAKEVGPSGIRVNCVAPGVIDTEMNAGLGRQTMDDLKDQTPLGLIGTPEDVAGAVCFLSSEQSAFITGQVLSPNGGFVI